MKKKIISLVLVLVIIFSSLALSITAFASSQELYLDTMATTSISGNNDLEWFYYTPDQSGLYSFMSFNVYRSDGYLFVKTVDSETGERKYTQLAYAGAYSSPNYKANGQQNNLQFCLTYHLEAGTTYYFAAGWWLSTQTKSSFNVMLKCDSYDEDAIDHIEIDDAPTLEAYVNGETRVDANGNSFYYYSPTKVMKNITFTVYYSNGTSTTVTGADSVDGYNVSYIDNQYENHWYPSEDENYTENTFTIKILDKTVSCDINIIIGARYSVKGTVLDFAGKPIENVAVSIGGTNVAYTDAKGNFAFYCDAGVKNVTFSTDTSIDLSKLVTITASANANNFTDSPFYLCNCDYVKDGYINAKDFAYISNNFTGSEFDSIKEEFEASINFSKYN